MRHIPLMPRLLAFVAAVALVLTFGFGTANAQLGGPSLRVTKVDTSAFPDVKVYVTGKGFPQPIESQPVTLSEDGQPQEVSGDAMEEVGTQTAIILDASGSIRDPGLTGEARYLEVGNALRQAVQTSTFRPQTDWIASYAPVASGEITVLKPWSRDHQAVADSIYLFQPDPVVENTPLFELLYFALDSFNDPSLPGNLQKSIVIFSDGVDIVSSLELDDAVLRANQANIKIHTVMVGPETEETRRNLERIATLTGGNYYQLTALDALTPLWGAVTSDRNQRVLSYRATDSNAREVTVSSQLPEGGVVSANASFPALNLAPPTVSVTSPEQGVDIQKEAAEFDTPLADLEPKTLDVAVDIEWPEGGERDIQRVEYTIGDDTRIVNEAPFNQISFPIDRLGDGNYTLRVRVFDEFGNVADAAAVPFGVTVVRPEAPPVEPQETIITSAAPIPNESPNTLSLIALGLGALALCIALFVMVRRPEMRQRAVDIFTDKIKVITEPFFMGGGKGARSGKSKAHLVVVEGGQQIPPVIELNESNTRLGRDSSLANVVLNDRRVSRYHCRITEESNNQFRIWDEGSTSGTYVNGEPIGMSGQVLQANDIINIGPIKMRFQLDRSPMVMSMDDPFAGTEPWVPLNNNGLGMNGHSNGNGNGNKKAATAINTPSADLDEEDFDLFDEDEDGDSTQPFPVYDSPPSSSAREQ